MQYSGRCITIGCLLASVICFGIGVAVGYFSNQTSDKPSAPQPTSSSKLPEALQKFQDACTTSINEAQQCRVDQPRGYVSYHLNGKTIKVDGKLDDEAWQEVEYTQDFLDIRGESFPRLGEKTEVKIRWDDTHVYVGARLQENKVWATYSVKDTRIYQENAFEVFLDVDRSMSMYKEIEINALGTTWDLILSRAYIDGGDFKDWEGITEKGVYTDGLVNIPSDNTTFWSLEMSFPFSSLVENTTRPDGPAKDGEVWFMIMARTEYPLEVNSTTGLYQQVPGTEAGWYAWQPTGAVNLHLPSKWGLLQFKKGAPVKNSEVQFDQWIMYKALFDIFDAQQSWKALNGAYTDHIPSLQLPPYVTSGSCLTSPRVELSDSGFTASVSEVGKPSVVGTINQNRYVSFS